MKTHHSFFILASQYCSTRCLATLIILLALGPSTHAAYCSLRDPLAAIHTLYPDADQHRSIVRTISSDTRNQIAERLPFTLHFNELGRHTLYVAQQQNLPIGLVHARSELSDWGLIEIAWAITTHLKIDNFYFQRCRHSACNNDLQLKLLNELKGKSLDDMLLLITPNGDALTSEMALKYQQHQSLVLSIIRSALKTIAATEYAWHEDIMQLRRTSVAVQWLGNKQLSVLLPVESNELENIQISIDTAPAYIFVEQSSIQAFRVMVDGAETARLVDATWQLGEYSGDFSWLFSHTGKVLAIKNHNPMPDQDTAMAFNRLLGQEMVLTENCAGAAEMAGSTLYLNAYKQIEIVYHED